jgi:hypothetical protein
VARHAHHAEHQTGGGGVVEAELGHAPS